MDAGPNLKVNRTMPHRPRNAELRSREYLTPDEVKALIAAARRGGRTAHRDAALILLGYRHGLRAAEIAGLRWEQLELDRALLHVRRVKGGTSSVHPLGADELRALRALRKAGPVSPFVFLGLGGAPMTTDGIRKIVARTGVKAGLPFSIHPHMLRHACGYKLANSGVDLRTIQVYLGHRQIQHTTRYTELAAGRFDGLWRD